MSEKREDWMSPLNRVIWLKAFRARQTEVTIRDGRKFKLNYDVRPLELPASGETRKLVHITPADGQFVPSGYFNLKEVTDPSWVKEDKTEVKKDLLDVKAGDNKDEQS